MIKAVVSNGFIKNCISTASKKCKKKGLPHYFNATAPSSFCGAGLPAELRLGVGSCVKILLPETEIQGLEGRGEQRGRPICRRNGA